METAKAFFVCLAGPNEFWVGTGVLAVLWPLGRMVIHARYGLPGNQLKTNILAGDILKGIEFFAFGMLTTAILFPDVAFEMAEHHYGIIGIAGMFACGAVLGSDLQAFVDGVIARMRRIFLGGS